MKVQIDGVEILNIDATSMTALNWRLVDAKQWIRDAVVGQISHAKGEMVKNEVSRIKGIEVGMPPDFTEDSMVTWLAGQPLYKDAATRKAEYEASL